MAPSLVQSATGTSTNPATTVTNTALAASPTVGNVLIAFCAGRTDGWAPSTNPGRWNMATRGYAFQSVGLFWTWVQAGDPTTYTFKETFAFAGSAQELVIQEWSGLGTPGNLEVNIGSPIDQYASGQNGAPGVLNNQIAYNGVNSAAATIAVTGDKTRASDLLAVAVCAVTTTVNPTSTSFGSGFTTDNSLLTGAANNFASMGHLILSGVTDLTGFTFTITGGTITTKDMVIAVFGPSYQPAKEVVSPWDIDPSYFQPERTDTSQPLASPFVPQRQQQRAYRGIKLFRTRQATTVRSQVNPTFVFPIITQRRAYRGMPTRRPERYFVIPPPAPAYPPPNVHRVTRGVRLFRNRLVTAFTTVAAIPPPYPVPNVVQPRRLRGIRLRRLAIYMPTQPGSPFVVVIVPSGPTSDIATFLVYNDAAGGIFQDSGSGTFSDTATGSYGDATGGTYQE